MKFPSWDLIIGVIFAVGLAYGFVLRRDRALSALASAYISLLVTESWGQSAIDFFQGNRVILNQIWVNSDASPTTIKIVLFLLVFFLLAGFTGFATAKTKISGLTVALVSFFTVGIVTSSVIGFLDPDSQARLFESSNFASLVWQYRPYWILAPVLVLVFMGIRYGEN